MTLIATCLLVKCYVCGVNYNPNINQLSKPQVEHLITKAYRKLDIKLNTVERDSLTKLCFRESSYRPNAKSDKSTAFGLFQLLKVTRENTNTPETLCYFCQTVGVVKYLHTTRRYRGSASRALQHHKRKGWY